MEHRHSQRKAINIDAVVEQTCGMEKIRITDASRGGVFIHWPNHGLSMYTPLVLSFRLIDQNSVRTFRWRGYVMHTSKGGIGAMIACNYPDDKEAMLALMASGDDYDQGMQLAG